jgi:tetratricopeptide (TPR) repeat protein
MYEVNRRISEKAIQANPNLVWAYQEQFRIHLIEGNFPKALEVAKFSHDISSANDELIDVGNAYLFLDSLDKAEAVFLEVIDKSEKDGIVWDDALAKYSAAAIRLWSLYDRTNRREEAEQMKLKAQGLFDSDFPKSYRVLYYQALYYAMNGEDQKAIEALERWNFKGLALTGSLDLFKMEPLLSDIIQSPEIQQLIARHEKKIASDREYIEETYDLDFE